MKYAMFVVVDPAVTAEDEAAAPPIEGWFEEMTARGIYRQGVRLQPPEQARTVRVRAGEVLVTDGPFTESREWIAGFAILEVASEQEAIEQALKHNMAYQGRLELRPIHSMGGPAEPA